MSFTIEMLLNGFAVYNERIWPMQLVGYAIVLLTLVPLFRRGKMWNWVVTGVLALLWLWLGLAFWLPAAMRSPMYYVPVALFILQGILFIVALARGSIAYGPERRVDTIVGIALVSYALIAYPLVGMLVGHTYPHMALPPLFPCPATVLTFGVLFFAQRVPRHLLIIPALWAFTGILWLSIGMVEDIGLLLSGIVGVVMLFVRERAARRVVATT
jgi:hypothetical protein